MSGCEELDHIAVFVGEFLVMILGTGYSGKATVDGVVGAGGFLRRNDKIPTTIVNLVVFDGGKVGGRNASVFAEDLPVATLDIHLMIQEYHGTSSENQFLHRPSAGVPAAGREAVGESWERYCSPHPLHRLRYQLYPPSRSKVQSRELRVAIVPCAAMIVN